MGLKYILILCFLHFDTSFGVIYNLNVTEYKKLPPIYDVDPYETCFEDDNAMYCYVQVALVSDNYNPTLELIKEYSAFTTAHFNHSKLRHCICISRTCKTTYNSKSLDLDRNIESCLNETFYEKYGLKTKLLDAFCVNSTTSNDMKIEFIDVVMLVVLAFILIMNFIGTMDDIRCVSVKRNYSVWARIFLNFSIRRNWNRLRASACDGPDPRIKRLRGINGLKVIALSGVIGAHSLISAVIFIDNPQDIETMFKHKAVQVIFNWTDFMQLFFMASGLLLTYNLLIISETRTLDWMMVPKGIILRWFRLTPLYAIVVLFSVSWIRFFGYEPAKHLAVMDEVTSCRKYWWMNLLYINNVFEDTTCVNQSWYIAADTQLYCLGLIVFLICKSPSRRKIVLPLLLIAGVVIPALVTYLYDLDGVLVMTPETVAQFFITDPTFNYLYKQSYTNTFNYVVGLGLGYMIYHGQQKNLSLDKYKKFRFFFWLIFPLCVGIASLGIVLYSQAPRQSILVRTLLAAFVKPVLGLVAAVGVIGVVFKYESLYRSVLEWSPFTPLARLTYSAYLLHVTIIRIMYSTNTTNSHVTSAMIQQSFYITTLTFVFSVPLYLMVEQPFGQLLKVFFTLKKTKDGEDDTNIKEIDVEKKNGTENMSVA